MEYIAFWRMVFIYDSEGRARGIFGNAQFMAQRVDECGFAGAHLAVEEERFFGAGEVKYGLRGGGQIVEAVKVELHLNIFAPFVPNPGISAGVNYSEYRNKKPLLVNSIMN